ncbi:MAG: hypothetical protein NWT02_02395 [Opitutales bacterium]|jgi:hypothetical protein|nr:hypothetical protein [Opitutales bacterium]MDP4643177.1 hypothetical protein [Opitutales bacterium]MDP4776475.1 hypothetical protein [Opitutales bacterium]MDP4882574.1 hypothetical protein [Opitutales bacterium]MDP5079156.1 hypothetical protein [Opitutales bacterium]
MIDEKFSELVNLYLDKEISSSELETLKAELAANADRKADFTERCRLHQAMRLALGASTSSKATRRRSSPSSTRSTRLAVPATRQTAPVATFPRWMLGAGLAASMAVGGFLLFPTFTDTTHASKQELEGVEEAELVEKDIFEAVDRSDLKRFANTQQQAIQRAATLAAQLRLLGLRPEVTDGELTLQEVSYASTQPSVVPRRRVVIFNELKDYSPIPEPMILESADPRPVRAAIWPSGFQTTLATFK